MSEIIFKFFPNKSFSIKNNKPFVERVDIKKDEIPSKGQLSLFEFLYQETLLRHFSFNIEVIFLERIILHNRDLLSDIMESGKKPYPKIFIGTIDILEQQELSSSIHLKALNEVDNNIWLYYVMINRREKFIANINDCLEKIRYYYQNQYYDLIITQEYLSIHRTIVKQNKIEAQGGGHASQILPFVFTSETNFKVKTKKTIEKIKHQISQLSPVNDGKIVWKVLMIDDYCEKKLRINDQSVRTPMLSKSDVFFSVIQEIEDGCPQIKFNTEYADNIENGLEKLKKNAYDIILIDYLFSEDSEFGIKLLLELRDDNAENTYKVGPFGKYWIIPISVFSNAFIDDMRNQGIDFTNQKWELSRGADFINTPWLFLYYFTQVQLQQVTRVTNLIGENIDEEIDFVLEQLKSNSLEEVKSTGLEKYQDLILSFKDFTSLNDAESGFLTDVLRILKSNNANLDLKKIRHFHAFLYYLGFKNNVNNEDLVIEYQILKSLMKNG